MVMRLLRRNRWLLARRAVQGLVLASFVSTPWWELPPARGTLAASRWFGSVPLTDPMVALQTWLAGTPPAATALLGAAIVAAFYVLVAGRLFCAWVCPVNLVTDAAEALRRALGLGAVLRADRRLRYLVLALALAGSAAFGVVLWEAVNPIGWAMRGVVFGLWGGALVAIAAVFFFDLAVLRHGWCGHVCPVGAFYALLGRFGRLNVEAVRASACTRCGDCFDVCPEVQVIAPVLREGAPVTAIIDADCLRCGRCIDRCDENVFAFRLDLRIFPSSK
jgi:ferredoxin-type protein NapH